MTDQTTKSRKPRRMAREPNTDTVNLPEVPAPSAAAKPQFKASLVEGLLQREVGASLDELCQATGWLPHTCRAFLTGLRKKGRALERSKREDGVTIYRMAMLQAAA